MDRPKEIDDNQSSTKQSVRSLQRALCILDAFSIDNPKLTLGEISTAVKLPRPTVTRLLATFIDSGFIVRIEGTRYYTLAVKLCRLGLIAQKSWELKKVALPVLQSLKNRFGETTYLDIVDGFDRLCILSVEGNQAVRTVVSIGQRAPLYAGADGRLLLAYQPDSVINEVTQPANLISRTDRTITNQIVLKEALAKIRQEGFAISFGEWAEGSIGISAPVRDHSGDVIAGVSMSVPDYRASKKIIELYTVEIIDVAKTISKSLGYRPR